MPSEHVLPAIDTASTATVGRFSVGHGDELRVSAEATNWGSAVLGFFGRVRLGEFADEIDPGQRLSADRVTAVIDVRGLAEVELRVLTGGGQSATDVRLVARVE